VSYPNVIAFVVALSLPGGMLATAPVADGPLAPELSGLGSLTYPVTTQVPRAQRFFDQGLRLLYAFNHAEALRAFREAGRLDPGLAMAYWGQAMALAPNLNAPMPAANGPLAIDAVRRAERAAAAASARERDLVAALAARFSTAPTRIGWRSLPSATRTIPRFRRSTQTPS
jgi:hypothetical protein